MSNSREVPDIKEQRDRIAELEAERDALKANYQCGTLERAS